MGLFNTKAAKEKTIAGVDLLLRADHLLTECTAGFLTYDVIDELNVPRGATSDIQHEYPHLHLLLPLSGSVAVLILDFNRG